MFDMSSHPTMGAWIEIKLIELLTVQYDCRTPRWVRGLKSTKIERFYDGKKSHPTMGAWIEIHLTGENRFLK